MTRPVIEEITEDEAIVRYTDRFFRRVHARTRSIGAAYDGKYWLLCVIAVSANPSEQQMDDFELDVEAIAGVYNADILIGPNRIPVDRLPTGHDLFIVTEAGFAIEPTPE